MTIDWNYLFASFDGRIGRRDFWIGAGLLLAANLVGHGLIAVLFGSGAIGSALSFLYGVALMFPGFAVLAKRFHDRGKSGWWGLIAFVPLIGLIWIVVDCGVLEGDPGPNQYGPQPRPALAG